MTEKCPSCGAPMCPLIHQIRELLFQKIDHGIIRDLVDSSVLRVPKTIGVPVVAA